jgi:hypothetical protein
MMVNRIDNGVNVSLPRQQTGRYPPHARPLRRESGAELHLVRRGDVQPEDPASYGGRCMTALLHTAISIGIGAALGWITCRLLVDDDFPRVRHDAGDNPDRPPSARRRAGP